MKHFHPKMKMTANPTNDCVQNQDEMIKIKKINKRKCEMKITKKKKMKDKTD